MKLKSYAPLLAVMLITTAGDTIAKSYVRAPFDRTPEIVAGSGLENEALTKLLDDIERENAECPFIVTRTKWLVALFDHTRLAVATNDTFVDWFPSTGQLPWRQRRRIQKFAETTPALKCTKPWISAVNGAYVACLDPSHVCPDWESVLSLGPTGLAERARKRKLTARDEKERLFLDCVIEVYEAMSRLAKRWATAADQVGNAQVAATLREIAAHEPRTLREALQLGLLYDRCQEAEGESVRTQGLFDRLYFRFYRDDLAAGRETRSSAKALIGEMFLKLYRQWHQNGKNIAFGGYGRDGRAVWNDLTEIGFELHYEQNHHIPKLTYRYGAKTPHEQMLKVANCLASGRTSIVFMNEEVSKAMFMRRGKSAEDTADAVLVGCYEPAIQGREVIASMAAWVNLAKPIEAAFNGGADFSGRRIGPDCALPQNYAEFEREYLRQLDALVDEALDKTRQWEMAWGELNPSPLMSGAFRDAIANAKDAYGGGMKYNQSGVMCAGLATMADSLAAVKYLVDDERLITMAALRDALKSNWAGKEELRLRVSRAAPKWGNNDDRADLPARRVYERLTKRINSTPNGHGGTYQAGVWSIDNDEDLGKYTAATPNGRRDGEAISRNNSATAGCGKGGPTALVNSQVKLDLADAPDGFITDVILPASIKHDDRAAERVAIFLETFAKLGGQCIHLNVFDSKTLRDAQAHPEKYQDLQVRVCGWNVRWVDLSRPEQEHFIATAEAQE